MSNQNTNLINQISKFVIQCIHPAKIFKRDFHEQAALLKQDEARRSLAFETRLAAEKFLEHL